jgi:outer membrane lipoprotein-sorting protein
MRTAPLVLLASLTLPGCNQDSADAEAEEVAEQAQRFEKQAEERAADFEERLAARAEEGDDPDAEDEARPPPDG